MDAVVNRNAQISELVELQLIGKNFQAGIVLRITLIGENGQKENKERSQQFHTV